MFSADGIEQLVMHTLRQHGAHDAIPRLTNYYALLEQDRKQGHLTEEEFQQVRAALDQVGERLQAEIEKVEATPRRSPASAAR